jgi:hypothetical protein
VGLKELLTGLGFECWFREFADGEHWIDQPRGREDLVEFLEKRVEGVSVMS